MATFHSLTSHTVTLAMERLQPIFSLIRIAIWLVCTATITEQQLVTCPTTVDGSELSTTTKRPLPTVPCVGTECPDNGFKDDSSFTDDCIGVTSTETLSTTSENEITTNDSITTSAPAESDSTTTKKSPPTEPCQGLECLETSSSQTNSMMTTQQHPNYTEPTTDTENSSEFISTLIPHSTSDESITEDQLSSTSPTNNCPNSKKSIIDSYFEDETTIENWNDESSGDASHWRVIKWPYPVDKPTDPLNTQAPTPLGEGFGYLQLIKRKSNVFAVAVLRSANFIASPGDRLQFSFWIRSKFAKFNNLELYMATGTKEIKLISLSEYSTPKNKQWQTKSVEIKPLAASTNISLVFYAYCSTDPEMDAIAIDDIQLFTSPDNC